MDIIERIKTIEDVLIDNNYTQESFYKWCEGLTNDEVGYRLCKLIVKTFNEGWVPNWSDSNQPKYCLYFYVDGSSGFRFDDGGWASRSGVGSLLVVKSKPIAVYIGKTFTNVFKQFML